MESEYLALSQAMRDIIPLHEILKEVNKIVFNRVINMPRCSASYKSFSEVISTEVENSIPTSKVYEDNNACLKFARLPRVVWRN